MTKISTLESFRTDNPNNHHYYVAYLIGTKIVCFKKVKGNKNTKNNKNIPLT